MTQMYNPAHPGAVIKEAIANTPTTVSAFAARIGVSRAALSCVINGRASVTAEMSMKLSEAFGQEQPDLWLRMQNNYDSWRFGSR